MSWLIAFAFSISGFAGLSLAMNKHQRKVFGEKLPDHPSRLYRYAGWSLTIASAIVCIAAFDWSFGLVALCGIASAASISVILLMTFYPEKLPLLCPIQRPLKRQSE